MALGWPDPGLQRLGEAMVSIGKLAKGQGRYYLEQAGGRVDRARSVSSGVEDYYVDGAEPEGGWIGQGTGALGVAGRVDGLALRRVLEGAHPSNGEPLGRHAAARVPGFDVTFSAPKSVSVLFGVGDDAMQAAIRRAHEVAVRDAFGYLERHAAVARRGAGGRISVRGNGLVAAAFRHRASRAGDPQLHTHAVVANLVRADDGRWSALDGRRLYAHAKTAGYLYEARLRAELTRELGVEWAPVRNGIADVVGVPSDVLRAFSRRRTQIEAELERRGQTGARAAQAATLETRRRKDHDVEPETLEREWQERADALGFTLERARAATGRHESMALDGAVLERVHGDLAGAQGLTQQRSTFTRRDVLQAWSSRLPAGAPVDVALLERLADHFLASPDAVPLAVGEPVRARDEVLRRRDGRTVRAVPDERRYSTRRLLLIEQAIVRRGVAGREAHVGVAATAATDAAITARPTLADEQRRMVRRLTRDGDAVAIVVGHAGTGKTYALAAAREAWEASGVPVVGAAVAWRAARGLEDGSGIPSTSVAALLERLRRDRLPRGAVLVVDEAGMVPTRQIFELMERVRGAGGKLVLVGDDHQLPEIDAGGAFRGLRARLPAIELRENRRQEAEWERDALALLRHGDADVALERYERHGRIEIGEGAAIREQLVADWWSQCDPVSAVMLAYRRDDVADLNRRARERMVESGALRGPELVVSGHPFAAGDHLVLRRNDRRLGVANGVRAIVVAVDPDRGSMTVRVAGRDVALPRAYVQTAGRPAIQHGYALTAHTAQGLTVDRAFVLATEEASREWLYTALSRGRLENRLYGAPPALRERDDFAPAERERDAGEVLRLAARRSAAQRMAIDLERRPRDRGVGHER